MLLDTVRYDAMKSAKHPLFERLGETSFVYTRAYAPSSFTAFSLFGLLGARLPTGYEVDWCGHMCAIPSEPFVGLPSWLRRRGYDTALVGAVREEETPYFKRDAFGNDLRHR